MLALIELQRGVDLRGIIAAVALAMSLGLASPARAEWLAVCDGGKVASCHAEACGGTREEARALCLEQCPEGDSHSVGTSSCTVQRKTQTPPARSTPATKSSTPAQ